MDRNQFNFIKDFDKKFLEVFLNNQTLKLNALNKKFLFQSLSNKRSKS